MDGHRAIYDFDTFETEDLERLVEIDEELHEMGLDGLDDDMMAEVRAELAKHTEEDDAAS